MINRREPKARVVGFIAVSSKDQAKDDKVSLQYQESLLSDWCAENRYQLVDLLAIRGHSRSESDIFTLFEDYASIGEYAYHQMRAHWQADDFDILWAFHLTRLGRSFSIQALILENAIKKGRFGYFYQGGWVDSANVDNVIALGGAVSKSEVRYRTAMVAQSMRGRVEKGLHTRRPPFTHRAIYNEKHEQVGLEVREDRMPLFEAAADLLLEGVGYYGIARALTQQGFFTEKGKPYAMNAFYRMFFNPYTWGYSGEHFDNKAGLWVFDESVKMPDGVYINRNPDPPIPPVWTGDRAEAIKAERRRRSTLITGRARPYSTYALTGLINCAICGRRMTVTRYPVKGGWKLYWTCGTNRNKYDRPSMRCLNSKYLRDEDARKGISSFFKRWAKLNNPTVANIFSKPNEDAQRVSIIEKQIGALNDRISTMITRQAAAPTNVQDHYATLITQASNELKTLESSLWELRSKILTPSQTVQRQRALDWLLAHIDEIWNLPPTESNRALLEVMGNYRFIAMEGKITDVREI